MILHLGYFGPATTHEVKGEEELISLHYITVAALLLAWRWLKEILSNFVYMEFNKTDQGSFSCATYGEPLDRLSSILVS